MLCALSTFSQETTEKTIKKNEIKINLLYFILDFPEITYERLLTDQTALGVSVAFPIESGASMLGNDLNFIMNPYYRVYFGEKPNTGFFVDGNAALFSQRKTEDDFFTGEKEDFVFRKGVIKKFNGAFLVSKKKYYIRRRKFSTPFKNFRTVL